jgi:hypothetical protein
MNWTFQDHRHYSAEHLQKVDKQRLTQHIQRDYLPVRKRARAKYRPCFQTIGTSP